MNIILNVKHMGKHRNSVQEYSMTLDNIPHTVGDLLEEMVIVSIRDYKQRIENSHLLKVLSNEEIEDKAYTGKVNFGVNYGDKVPDLNQAILNAKESFADGIVVLFFGDEQLLELEQELNWNTHTKITLIKMTMLTGRLW